MNMNLIKNVFHTEFFIDKKNIIIDTAFLYGQYETMVLCGSKELACSTADTKEEAKADFDRFVVKYSAKINVISMPVYEHKRFGNCSNNGITNRYDEIYLICPNGDIEIPAAFPPENLFKLCNSNVNGEKYYYLEPAAMPDEIGWMNGGSYAGVRYQYFDFMPVKYPIPVHDRQESREFYMSND